MRKSQTCTVCIALALAWIVIIGVLAYMNWPHFPLDISPVDPSTIAAMREAVLKHVALYAAIAFVPPLVVWLAVRRRK